MNSRDVVRKNLKGSIREHHLWRDRCLLRFADTFRTGAERSGYPEVSMGQSGFVQKTVNLSYTGHKSLLNKEHKIIKKHI
jgi:hypothetical protein